MGHLGVDRVVSLARERFYWPDMRQDIANFISWRCQCLKQKPSHHTPHEPLQPIATSVLFEVISINYLHLERSSGGYKYVLVVVDHFTRYVQAYATRTSQVKRAANLLYNDFILCFEFPSKIHHDQGREFENELFHHLEELSDVIHSQTTSCHPQGDGKIERFNRTLLSMLCTLPEAYKSHWRDHLPKLVHAYNCTRHEATGFSPFALLFRRSLRLPTDLLFGIGMKQPSKNYPSYVTQWRNAMQEAYRISASKSSKSASQAKLQPDKKAHSTTLPAGDRVLIENFEKGGPGKIRSYWE